MPDFPHIFITPSTVARILSITMTQLKRAASEDIDEDRITKRANDVEYEKTSDESEPNAERQTLLKRRLETEQETREEPTNLEMVCPRPRSAENVEVAEKNETEPGPNAINVPEVAESVAKNGTFFNSDSNHEAPKGDLDLPALQTSEHPNTRPVPLPSTSRRARSLWRKAARCQSHHAPSPKRSKPKFTRTPSRHQTIMRPLSRILIIWTILTTQMRPQQYQSASPSQT